ncbi:MAG: ABC transporter permease, partial [bacterium]
MLSDVRHALRLVIRSPGVTALAVLTLALGVGANTAVFSVVDPLLLRSLPVQDPSQLVLLHSAGTLETVDFSERPTFERYSAEHDVLAGVVADAGLVTFDTDFRGRHETARGELVSANFFAVLGVAPRLGRILSPDDDAGRDVIVVSSGYWMRALGADPAV